MPEKSIYIDVQQFDPVLPDHVDWPLYQMSLNREQFISEVAEATLLELKKSKRNNSRIRDIIAKTYYLEKIRMKSDPYKIDPEDEKPFWKKVKSKLTEVSIGNIDNEDEEIHQVLKSIVKRYSNEIAGNFKISTFRFAQRMTPLILRRVLNSASAKYLKKFYANKYHLSDVLHFTGPINKIRSLVDKGTLVFVPTHFSNMDSILVGWAIESIGIPPLIYGAGLNLFNSRIMGYYMGRLGAYTLDRRKKNPIYLETLKTYSRLSVEKGCHYLFYPGGTRARSGALETRFKLGLLGTITDAQYENCLKNEEAYKKIFIVPVVINYHFVLEAKQLIEQHLKKTGEEKYLKNDEADIKGVNNVMSLVWKFFSTSSEMAISFGKPMDIFGNDVDEEGNSTDKHGQQVKIHDYFKLNGKIVEDQQRNQIFTGLLADHILKEYRKSTIVFSSQLLAFAAFQIIKSNNKRLDIYELLRLPEDDRTISYDLMTNALYKLIQHLKAMNESGQILLDPQIHKSIDQLIEHGLKNLGVYHNVKPLILTEENEFVSNNMNLLYFYHNRLSGFGLETVI